MDWLNFHHLMYFFYVVREGSVSRAAGELRRSPQAILTQIRALEAQLQVELLVRRGRRLVPTEVGSHVYELARDIYSAGRQVGRLADGQVAEELAPLRLGVVDGIPKVLISRLVERVWQRTPGRRVIVSESDPDILLHDLRAAEHDAIVVEGPLARGRSQIRRRAVMETTIAFFAAPSVARAAKAEFPKSLAKIPMVVPTPGSSIRRVLDPWFEGLGVRPCIVAEVDDAEMLASIAVQASLVFPAPYALSSQIRAATGAELLANAQGTAIVYELITRNEGAIHPSILKLYDCLPLCLERRARRESTFADAQRLGPAMRSPSSMRPLPPAAAMAVLPGGG